MLKYCVNESRLCVLHFHVYVYRVLKLNLSILIESFPSGCFLFLSVSGCQANEVSFYPRSWPFKMLPKVLSNIKLCYLPGYKNHRILQSPILPGLSRTCYNYLLMSMDLCISCRQTLSRVYDIKSSRQYLQKELNLFSFRVVNLHVSGIYV